LSFDLPSALFGYAIGVFVILAWVRTWPIDDIEDPDE
jgi:hypothetical protein